MSKELNPSAGLDNLICDECKALAMYTCAECFGDYCGTHREHQNHE